MALFNWLEPLRNLRQEINPYRQSLRSRILNNPYYRLQSAEEIAVAASIGVKIDVNQATVDDWLRLPGLSIHQARSLVELSHMGVRFYCLEDIAAALGLPGGTLKHLEPVLSFCYYDEESLDAIGRVNPNTASEQMLSKIPGVDSVLAAAIAQNRLEAGAYRNLVDLQRRLSLPSDLISQLMHYLRF
jgi:DNA uptake protein ComE-like DNA-binding protein